MRLRSGFIEPDLVVDVKRIAAMQAITPKTGGFRIGARRAARQLGEHRRRKTGPAWSRRSS